MSLFLCLKFFQLFIRVVLVPAPLMCLGKVAVNQEEGFFQFKFLCLGKFGQF